jgi:hypothetical protein
MQWDIQTVFYTLGIVFMTLVIVMLIGMGVAIFIITRKISQIQKNISEKFTTFANITTHSKDLAADVGSALAGAAFNKVKEAVTHKKIKR